jgi:hypothetical protein
MDALYTILLILLLLFIFYEQTRAEGFKTTDEYSHLSEEEKTKVILKNDAKLLMLYKKANLSSLYNNNKKSISELSKPAPKYRIAFVTFEDRDNQEYIKLHDLNVKKYCDKWGYEYFRVRDNPLKISQYWTKVSAVKDLMDTNKYDYVFWMDSDTVINNFNIDLGEDILHKYDSDIFVASDNIKYDVINSGLFIIKNSKIGKEFIKDWIDTYMPTCEKGGGWLKGKWAMSCYEQGTQNKLIIEKYNKYTTFLDSNIFHNNNSCDETVFVMHHYGGNAEKRAACFKKAPH